MGDLPALYSPMIEQFADQYSDEPLVHAQLRSLRVTSEKWDDNRGGGHFWFDVSAPAADYDFVIEVTSDDSDGGLIDILLHSVAGLVNWGEWYKLPRTATHTTEVLRWPPISVTRSPNFPFEKSPRP